MLNKGYTVLIIDADGGRSWARGLAAWLEAAGNRVFRVADGDEALLVLEAHTVDAVVSAYAVRCADGGGLLSRVRRDYPSVQRVVQCSRSDEPLAIAARSDGCIHGFLVDTWSAPEAEQVLYALLEPRPRRRGGATLYEIGV